MTSPSSRSAWVVWGVGVGAYFLAVFHRSSLAVAGLVAADRFGISAAQLATFTMLQLLVYAGMQVPVGLLVDRFGPRRVLLTGMVVIGVAQVGFAFADSYALALIARVFVGAGDAMTFICLLRLAASWFPPHRFAMVSLLSATVGQLGAVAAAVPMTWALGALGWTEAYLIAAVTGLVLTLVALALLRDGPERRTTRGATQPLREVLGGLADSWRHPGTRLAFWVHFTTPFGANTLSLLWGLPFFVRGEGRSDHVAGLLITLIVVATVSVGPMLGWFIGQEPWHRSTLVLWIIGATVAVWSVVLAWPGNAPLWLLVVLVLVIGCGGPASMVGFDIARTANPPARLASASGIVNQGGFLSSLLLVLAIGWILDWRTPGGGSGYPPEAFRWALSAQYVVWAVGLTQIVRYRRRARIAMPRSSLAPVSDAASAPGRAAGT
ncbi:MFS transporter [Nocardioides sp.]|uniref:MFS transporter n=1 Tax=Nocardioides sp. TaxID=35761 RepID=UPI0039E613C4